MKKRYALILAYIALVGFLVVIGRSFVSPVVLEDQTKGWRLADCGDPPPEPAPGG
jgi:hypothetical protein